jgi:hypothetical protein
MMAEHIAVTSKEWRLASGAGRLFQGIASCVREVGIGSSTTIALVVLLIGMGVVALLALSI